MFTENLELDLTLTIGGTVVHVPGGDVTAFRIALHNYGFEGELTFWTSPELGADPLFDSFTTNDLMKVKLDIKGVTRLPPVPPDALSVSGLVTKKVLREVTARGAANIEFRRYTIDFADIAQVLWKEHRPCDLLADSSPSDLLNAHLCGATLNTNWTALGVDQPIICLGLGDDEHGASFYDFVMWYVHKGGGVFYYDATDDAYTIDSVKAADGTAAGLNEPEVDRIQIVLPPPPRHDARILNSNTDSGSTTSVANTEAAAGVHLDFLIRTSIADEVTAITQIETDRLKAIAPPLIDVYFKRYPTVTFRPGSLVKIEGGWSNKIMGYGGDRRVLDVLIEGENPVDGPPQSDRHQKTATYDIVMRGRLEDKNSAAVTFPPFKKPDYPILVEGKVVSAGGEETDKTYQIVTDDKTSITTYTVNVVLWNKKIIVPFVPDIFPGHFYFPAFKNQRVLLELGFAEARLARYLDWGSGAQTPVDNQGNMLMLGKDPAKSFTSFLFDYESEKPVTTISRLHEGDSQVITIEDGTLSMVVKADDSEANAVETYDVTLQVEMAKGDLSAKVGGGVTDVSTKFGASEGQLNTHIATTQTDIEAKMTAIKAEVQAQCDEQRAKIEALRASLADQTAPVLAAAAKARADLEAAKA
jgi:hypothetical protein